MKKLSKKAWKEYIDDESNWEPRTWIPEGGLRISVLKETDIRALEEWHEPNEWVREMGVKPSWRKLSMYVVHENEDGQRYREQLTKTEAIEKLWKAQEGKR